MLICTMNADLNHFVLSVHARSLLPRLEVGRQLRWSVFGGSWPGPSARDVSEGTSAEVDSPNCRTALVAIERKQEGLCLVWPAPLRPANLVFY